MYCVIGSREEQREGMRDLGRNEEKGVVWFKKQGRVGRCVV